MPATNRRQLLTGAAAYAAGAAIVAGGAALAGEAKGATTEVSPALTRLLAEYQRRDAILGTWYETVWNPTTDALRADLAVVRHTTRSVAGYRNVLNEHTPPQTFSTANKMDVARCKGIVSIPVAKQSDDPRWLAVREAAADVVKADDWRQRESERIHARHDMARKNRRETELCAAVDAVDEAILAFPVNSFADALAKLAHLKAVAGEESDRTFPMVVVDLTRLAGSARA